MFGHIPNITFIRNTEFSNGKISLFNTFLVSNGLETQRGNQPLPWSSQIIFLQWRCDFHILQIITVQRDVQGDVLPTILDLYVFLTLQQPKFSLLTCANFPSHNVFQVEQLWWIDGCVTTDRILLSLRTYV